MTVARKIRIRNPDAKPKRPAADTEAVWMLNSSDPTTDMDNVEADHGGQYQVEVRDNRGTEQVPPPLMAGGRSDTINSTTVFASLSEIQPRNSYRYSGTSINILDTENNPQILEQHQDEICLDDLQLPTRDVGDGGIKRHHEDGLTDNQHNKVIVVHSVGADGNISLSSEQIQGTFYDPFDIPSIPLGGEAGTVIAKTEQSWTPSPATITRIIPEHQLERSDHPRPTSRNPGIDDYPGHFMFDVAFTKSTTNIKNKYWDYSHSLKKLFIDMNKWVQVEFKVGANVPGDLNIRAMPIFSDASNFGEPVRRCPNHASSSDQTNTNFRYPHHLIRLDNERCKYEEDESSGRLSILFPVQTPHEGTDRTRELMKFMCLGSDVGGINRRPLKVIFTLETGGGRVVGRKVFDVRICSCPRRDKAQEEEKYEKLENNAKGIADRVANSFVMNPLMAPPGKKVLKKETNQKDLKSKYIMIPVLKDDFGKFNELTESLEISRAVQKNPGEAKSLIDKIKEDRKRLLIDHNPHHVSATTNKKPRV